MHFYCFFRVGLYLFQSSALRFFNQIICKIFFPKIGIFNSIHSYFYFYQTFKVKQSLLLLSLKRNHKYDLTFSLLVLNKKAVIKMTRWNPKPLELSLTLANSSKNLPWTQLTEDDDDDDVGNPGPGPGPGHHHWPMSTFSCSTESGQLSPCYNISSLIVNWWNVH